MLAFSLWIGNRFMAAEHGSRTRGEVLELVLAALVSPRPSTLVTNLGH